MELHFAPYPKCELISGRALSPIQGGYTEAIGKCPANSAQIAAGDNGKVLCSGGAYEATMDSTWRSPDMSGVFIRLL